MPSFPVSNGNFGYYYSTFAGKDKSLVISHNESERLHDLKTGFASTIRLFQLSIYFILFCWFSMLPFHSVFYVIFHNQSYYNRNNLNYLWIFIYLFWICISSLIFVIIFIPRYLHNIITLKITKTYIITLIIYIAMIIISSIPFFFVNKLLNENIIFNSNNNKYICKKILNCDEFWNIFSIVIYVIDPGLIPLFSYITISIIFYCVYHLRYTICCNTNNDHHNHYHRPTSTDITSQGTTATTTTTATTGTTTTTRTRKSTNSDLDQFGNEIRNSESINANLIKHQYHHHHQRDHYKHDYHDHESIDDNAYGVNDDIMVSPNGSNVAKNTYYSNTSIDISTQSQSHEITQTQSQAYIATAANNHGYQDDIATMSLNSSSFDDNVNTIENDNNTDEQRHHQKLRLSKISEGFTITDAQYSSLKIEWLYVLFLIFYFLIYFSFFIEHTLGNSFIGNHFALCYAQFTIYCLVLKYFTKKLARRCDVMRAQQHSQQATESYISIEYILEFLFSILYWVWLRNYLAFDLPPWDIYIYTMTFHIATESSDTNIKMTNFYYNISNNFELTSLRRILKNHVWIWKQLRDESTLYEWRIRLSMDIFCRFYASIITGVFQYTFFWCMGDKAFHQYYGKNTSFEKSLLYTLISVLIEVVHFISTFIWLYYYYNFNAIKIFLNYVDNINKTHVLIYLLIILSFLEGLHVVDVDWILGDAPTR